jgi:CheY-like chemotaxis protein
MASDREKDELRGPPGPVDPEPAGEEADGLSSADPLWLEVAILASESGRPSQESGPGPGSDGDKVTIAVVARTADMRDYVLECLRDTGFRIVAAADLAAAAAEAFRADTPDLVVLDVSESGDETDAGLLPLSSLAAVPRVVIIDEASREAPAGWPETGAAAVLVKPFNARRLQQEVRRCLQRSGGTRGQRPSDGP